MKVLVVPVDSGVVGERRGAGPDVLLEAGLLTRVGGPGGKAAAVRLLPSTGWRAELRTTFELHRQIAEAVRNALAAGDAPLVVAGDCNATVGAVAGLGSALRTGIVWFDAHGDFNTPETDRSGFLDGQGLAMVTGRGWAAHTGSLPGFAPVPDHRVLLVGARDLDDAESEALDRSGVLRLDEADTREGELFDAVLDELCSDVDRLHVHVDADVLDPSLGRPNGWAAPGGLTVDRLLAVVRAAHDRAPIASVTIASWDPAMDPGGGVRDALLRIAEAIGALTGSCSRTRPAGSP